MDNTAERQTLDFMTVHSFSQLPFIRPPPPLPVKEKGSIRLFGKEFGVDAADHRQYSGSTENGPQREANKDSGYNSQTSNRKFECHYCCRNFPTSQALGGHQNAHKRERQQAKRAHWQYSGAMMHDSRVYGLLNYGRLGSAPTPPVSYHSWTDGGSPYSGSDSLFGGHGYYGAHQPQPMNGSPLGLWRAPVARSSSVYFRERPHQQMPLFSYKDPELNKLPSIGSSLGSQFRFGYEAKPGMQDHVSLDLRL